MFNSWSLYSVLECIFTDLALYKLIIIIIIITVNSSKHPYEI